MGVARSNLFIVVAFILGIVLSGCAHSQKIKVVTDIEPDGNVTYHTEYVAEF